MKSTPTPIEGVLLLEEEKLEDHRGTFSRMFCKKELHFEEEIVQINHSFSKNKGTLRGLHYQESPHEETKIVCCIAGNIWDVVVDLRNDSNTFHKYFGTILSPGQMMTIPKGCAHGFLTLEDNCEIIYFVTEFYNPAFEKGIRYNDPKINIEWPIAPKNISEKDLSYENLV